MKKVFVIGGATLDTIITYEDMETIVHQRKGSQVSYLLLGEGKKIEVTQQNYFSGGGATNAAVSLKKLGLDVSLLCKIGRDAPGEVVKKELAGYGIDLSKVLYSDNEGTASSFVVPSLQGDRTVFAYRGASTTLLSGELPLDQLGHYDFLYITSLSKQAAECLPQIVAAAKKQKVLVAINPGISQLKLGTTCLKDSLSEIDILILNYEEAEQFMESLFQERRFNIQDFCKEILKLGPRIVSVTNGAEGVYVGTLEAFYFHPSIPTQIVNTLGAGDAFGSCFVGSIYCGMSIAESMIAGLLNSASVISYPDAKTGLLTKVQLSEKRFILKEIKLTETQW
jgi:ribokinase